MPFDNFYEESDKANRRWGILAGLVLFCSIAYFVIFYAVTVVSDFGAAAETVSADPIERVRRVDELCRHLPLPEQFF